MTGMDMPEREISEAELRRSTGERGTRMYIALNGLVYDVTDCPKWRSGLHEDLHFAGQDLTEEFPAAPHMEEVFRHPCVTVVGRLKMGS
jgi:predicted heme/steroid binding protein